MKGELDTNWSNRIFRLFGWRGGRFWFTTAMLSGAAAGILLLRPTAVARGDDLVWSAY